MSFLNSLGIWSWVILLSIPPLILLLYFLKLKRRPLEVPSTYLWHRTIEDLHVNSIWQRLRKSLLLFLQLLLLALLIFACLRPGWQGAELSGDRFIFLIDHSASMSATDESGTRLEAAKRRVEELIEQMKSGDVAMIISFSDGATIQQSFTDNRATLRRKVRQIQPTARSSNLREALRAADGLANPGRTSVRPSEDPGTIDVQVADPLPATLYIFSDGGFAPATDFALGHLTPIYVPIGNQGSVHNVAIVAFSTERNPEKPERLQAFAELENFGDEDVSLQVSLLLNDELCDADQVTVPRGGTAGVQFALTHHPLDGLAQGSLRLEISHQDHLVVDNVAFAAINNPRRAQVLLVTPQNDALVVALKTEVLAMLADLWTATPDVLETKEHRDAVAAGLYDLVIYDQCAPLEMPRANTLCIASRPPLKDWTFGQSHDVPIVIDIDRAHPLMQLIELRDVNLYEGFTVTPSPGGTALIDSNVGTLFAIGPREGFEDAVLGFGILGPDKNGNLEPKTDWPRRLSFPIFVQNVVMYLGGARGAFTAPSVQPSQPVTLRTTTPATRIEVQSPSGDKTTVLRDAHNAFVFSNSDDPGVYLVREGTSSEITQRFAVNLFDTQESNLAVAPIVPIGHQEVTGQSGWQPARRELWKWLLACGLVVLVFEWYVYNRRVYL